MNHEFNDEELKAAISKHEKLRLLEMLEKNGIVKETNVKKRFSIQTYMIAASAMLAVGIAMWLFLQPAATLQSQSEAYLNGLADNYSTTTRATSMESDSCLILYQQKKWPQASACFEASAANPFFHSVALIEEKRYDDAIGKLNTVLLDKESLYSLDAHWLLALCLIQSEKPDLATEHLAYVAAQKQWNKSADAAKLLAQLKK